MTSILKLTNYCSTILIIITMNKIRSCYAIYIPVISNPKNGEYGELLSANLKNELECSPSDKTKPVLVISIFETQNKLLPPCPPNSAPLIHKKTVKNIALFPRETIHFDANYSGYPKPTVQYFGKDGKKLYETDRIKPLKGLVIINANRYDSGTYTMKLVSSEGEDSANFNVEVIDKPSPPVGPLLVTNITPNTITLNWSPSEDDGGSPITAYNIEKFVSANNSWVLVLDTMKISKTLGNLNPGEKYTFRIRAVNKKGSSHPLVGESVIPRGLPSMPGIPQVVNNKGLAQLEWTQPKRDNGDPVKGFLVEQRELPSGDWVTAKEVGQPNATLDDVKPGHQYHFRVRAINGVGKGDPSKESEPTLINQKPIKANIDKTKLKPQMESKIGDPFKLEAVITGLPEPEIQWTLNKIPINENLDNIKISKDDNKTILSINSLNPNQSGVYGLTVKNDVGVDEAFVNLTIPTAVENSQQWFMFDKSDVNDSEVGVGQPFKKVINAGVFPIPQYQWKLNGRPIVENVDNIKTFSDGIKSIPTIDSADLKHEGVYTLTLNSSLDKDEASFKLKVNRNPSIDKSGFNDKEAIIGKWVTFEAIIGGQPEPVIEWKLNGKPINETLNNIIIKKVANKAILTVYPVGENSAGVYTLSVNNPNGKDEVSAKVILLSVPRPPTDLSIEPILNGTKAVLKCKPPENDDRKPVTEYSFEKISAKTVDWVLLNKSKNCEIIADIEKNRNELFRVKAVNSLGESKPLTESIKDPEVFKQRFGSFAKNICNLDSNWSEFCAYLNTTSTLSGPIELDKVTNDSAQFKWNPPKDSRGLDLYQIEMFKPENNGWTTISYISLNQILVTGLQPNTSYRFRVTTVDAHRDSVPLETNITTLSNSYPIEGSIELIRVNTNTIEIKWDKQINSELPLIYRIEKLNNKTKEWESVANTTNNSAIISGLKCFSQNIFRVKAPNGSALESKVFTTLGDRPEPPSPPFRSYDLKADRMTLYWKASKDTSNSCPVKGYIIETQVGNSNNWESIGISPSFTNRLTNLQSNQSYRFRIKAFNDFGESDPLYSHLITTLSNESNPSNIISTTTTTTTITTSSTTITTITPIITSPTTPSTTITSTTVSTMPSTATTTTNPSITTSTTTTTTTTASTATPKRAVPKQVDWEQSMDFKLLDEDSNDLKALAMIDKMHKLKDEEKDKEWMTNM